jgi:hypothetical protein
MPVHARRTAQRQKQTVLLEEFIVEQSKKIFLWSNEKGVHEALWKTIEFLEQHPLVGRERHD